MLQEGGGGVQGPTRKCEFFFHQHTTPTTSRASTCDKGQTAASLVSNAPRLPSLPPRQAHFLSERAAESRSRCPKTSIPSPSAIPLSWREWPQDSPSPLPPSANSLPLGEGGREPIKALVKAVARCGTACLDIPLPVAEAVQAQLVCHLRCRHCVGEVLYAEATENHGSIKSNRRRGRVLNM